jgi:hypothetical protein
VFDLLERAEEAQWLIPLACGGYVGRRIVHSAVAGICDARLSQDVVPSRAPGPLDRYFAAQVTPEACGTQQTVVIAF